MISFFTNSNGSGQIRGYQIAAYLGGRVNPQDGYEGDVCIWVKRQPPDTYPPHSYLDIIDAHERIPWLYRHLDIGVIASSASGQRFLREKLDRHVVFIPQHHCNFERARHARQWPLRLGGVGGNASMPPVSFGVRWFANCRTRKDVVAAYQEIDVQVIWRQTSRPLKNALKIINAASFGIPTIAYPEPCYEEMESYYIPARTKEEVEEAVEALQDGFDRERLLAKAEEYHIEHVAQRYLDL